MSAGPQEVVFPSIWMVQSKPEAENRPVIPQITAELVLRAKAQLKVPEVTPRAFENSFEDRALSELID